MKVPVLAVPEPLKKHVAGDVICLLGKLVSGGFSTIGEKTLVVSDRPGIYFSDTGGLFRESKTVSIQGKQVTDPNYCWAVWKRNAFQMRIVCRAGGDRWFSFVLSGGDAAKFSDAVVKNCLPGTPDCPFHYPQLVPAVCGVGLEEKELGEKLVDLLRQQGDKLLYLLRTVESRLNDNRDRASIYSELESALEDGKLEANFFDYTRRAPPEIAILFELFFFGYCWGSPRVDGGRLTLSRPGNDSPVVDLPISQIDFERRENGVSIVGDFFVAGLDTQNIRVLFPSLRKESLVPAFMRALRAEKDKVRSTANSGESSRSVGLTTVVKLTGITGRRESCYSETADAILSESNLVLLSHESGETIHCFDLAAGRTSIHGKANSFLICDDDVGPIQIDSSSDSFQKRLLSIPAVGETARRSYTSGPFIAWDKDCKPTRITFHGDALELNNGSVSHRIQFCEISSYAFKRKKDVLRVSVHPGNSKGPLTIEGQDDMILGIADQIGAQRNQLAGVNSAEAMCNAVLSLEGEYFLFMVFKSLLEMNSFVQECVSSRSTDSAAKDITLEVPEESKKVELLTVLGTVAPKVRRGLEICRHYFPQFVVNQDLGFFSSSGMKPPRDLISQRAGYESALASLFPLIDQLAVIEREVMRLESVREAVKRSKPGFGGLALSIGTSFLTMNPVLLVGAVRQISSITGAITKSAASEKTAIDNAVGLAIQAWNYIFPILLPAISFKLEELVFPLRSALMATVINRIRSSEKTRTAIFKQITLRLARLENVLSYPCVGLVDSTGHDCTEHIRRLQKEAMAPQFIPF